MLTDLRYACRALRKTPGFALGVVLILALAIGANTAVFSVIDAALLHPLPFRDPDRIVTWMASPANFHDWRDQARSFTDIAVFSPFAFTIAGGAPEAVDGAVASTAYFRVLGIDPALGRTFSRDEDRWGAPRVVVLGDALWRRRFHADRNVLGASVPVNGLPYTVIGVMPPWRGDSDLWVPIENYILPERMQWRHEAFLYSYARLRPGVDLREAQAELKVPLRPLQEASTSAIRPGLLLLASAVALVLLIACANVANLMLVRAGGRERELAIRSALGASRARLVSHLLAESLLLSLAAGTLGAALAGVCLRTLVALCPVDIERFNEVRLDPTALAFALAASLAAGVVFALLPGLRSPRLRPGGRRLRQSLAVIEIGLSIVLLVAAGLLIRSFTALGRAQLGYSPRGLVMAHITLPRSRYPQDALAADFYNRVLDRLRATPGIEDAALAHPLPLEGDYATAFAVAGHEPAPGDPLESANFRYISPGYFSVLSIPLKAGRAFSDADALGAEPVLIISEAFAARYFPRENPLGKHLVIHRTDYPRVPRRIVGVVGDTLCAIDRGPQSTIYTPVRQMAFHGTRIVVRTAGNAAEAAATLHRAVESVDPEQPILRVRSLEEMVEESLRPWRFALTLITGLAAMAFALAVAGVFSVISHLALHRRREFGVRVALGAQPADIARLVLRRGAVLSLAGVALGVAGAAASTRLMRSLLYGVTPLDAFTFALAALVLVAAALAASYLPARRAARTDPLETLRAE